MEVDEKSSRGEGFLPYYTTKIEELQLVVVEKSQNLRRLQAQRNELNAKGVRILRYFVYINCIFNLVIMNYRYGSVLFFYVSITAGIINALHSET